MSRFDPRLYLDRWDFARLVVACAAVAMTLLVAATALAVGFPGAPSLGFQRALARDLGVVKEVSPHVVLGRARAIAFERPVPAAVPATIGHAVSTAATPPARAEASPPAIAPVTRTVPLSGPVPTVPVEAPPVETPPVETPPAEAPVETPPVEAPPVETPPVEIPPVEVLPPPIEIPLAPPPEPEPEPEPTPPVTEPEPEPALFEAGFESGGLKGWNIAGVGEAVPTVAGGIVREGDDASVVRLTGSENRSELILGGNGTRSTAGTIEFHEGDEYWYGFSFYIESMVYGHPGAHNLIMQFKSNGEGSPLFGLQLWDVNGEKGLWSAGTAMQIGDSGERFLAPVVEQAWHDVQIHFKASEVGNGFYEVFLDGNLIDARTGVTMIVPGTGSAYIKDGLYRNGEEIPGTSEIRLDAAKLGETQDSVLP